MPVVATITRCARRLSSSITAAGMVRGVQRIEENTIKSKEMSSRVKPFRNSPTNSATLPCRAAHEPRAAECDRRRRRLGIAATVTVAAVACTMNRLLSLMPSTFERCSCRDKRRPTGRWCRLLGFEPVRDYLSEEFNGSFSPASSSIAVSPGTLVFARKRAPWDLSGRGTLLGRSVDRLQCRPHCSVNRPNDPYPTQRSDGSTSAVSRAARFRCSLLEACLTSPASSATVKQVRRLLSSTSRWCLSGIALPLAHRICEFVSADAARLYLQDPPIWEQLPADQYVVIYGIEAAGTIREVPATLPIRWRVHVLEQ